MPQSDFDVLTYSRDLEASGFSRQQAETIARGMIRMLAQQLDTLVTRDHFDLHMMRIEQRFDRRIDGLEARIDGLDVRIDGLDARIDGLDARMDNLGARMDGLEARIGRLERTQAAHTVLLSIITIAVLIPLVQSTLAG